jgi:hypothetical protein
MATFQGAQIMNIRNPSVSPRFQLARRLPPSAIVVAAVLAAGGAFGLAQAAGLPVATAQATTTTNAQAAAPDRTDALLKFSQAGRDAYEQVRQARRDLFDGRTDDAIAEMRAAQSSLIVAKAEAPTFATNTQTKVMGKVVDTTKDSFTAQSVPLGGDLVLAENFQLSERHQPAMAQARQHLAKGDQKSAVQALKAGAIDVAYNRQWLPIAGTEKNLGKAINMATSKKYYEANLALKAIEDGVQVDTVSFIDPPAAS